MDNPIGITIGAVGGVALLVMAYYLGLSDGRLEEREEPDELLFPLEELLLAEARERAHAFARAADAVALWPHRVDKRADLARHLDSLATAPDLGAPTLNTAATTELESFPGSPVPVADPVLVAAEESPADMAIVDVYRAEGFL